MLCIIASLLWHIAIIDLFSLFSCSIGDDVHIVKTVQYSVILLWLIFSEWALFINKLRKINLQQVTFLKSVLYVLLRFLWLLCKMSYLLNTL